MPNLAKHASTLQGHKQSTQWENQSNFKTKQPSLDWSTIAHSFKIIQAILKPKHSI